MLRLFRNKKWTISSELGQFQISFSTYITIFISEKVIQGQFYDVINPYRQTFGHDSGDIPQTFSEI